LDTPLYFALLPSLKKHLSGLFSRKCFNCLSWASQWWNSELWNSAI